MNSIQKSFVWNHKAWFFYVVCALIPIKNASATDYPSTILADHPVAYYRLEEPSGSATVADSSGNGFTGYISYITQADGTTVFPQLGLPGIDTHSALFATSTGVGQGHVDIPVNSTINPTLADGVTGAPFTAELWVRATTQSSGYGVPLDDSGFFNSKSEFLRLEFLSDRGQSQHLVLQPPAQSWFCGQWSPSHLGPMDPSGTEL